MSETARYRQRLRPLILSSMKPEDFVPAIQRWADEVKKEFISAEKMNFATLAQQTEFIQSVVPPSGGAGTVVTNNYINLASVFPSNSASVVAGSNVVAFVTPMAGSDYEIVSCYMLSGTTLIDLLGEVTAKATTGFTVTCPSAGTLFYGVMPLGYTSFSQACTAGSNVITFSHAFGASDYIVIACYAVASGVLIDLRGEVTAQAVGSLTVTVPQTCTVVGACVPRN